MIELLRDKTDKRSDFNQIHSYGTVQNILTLEVLSEIVADDKLIWFS